MRLFRLAWTSPARLISLRRARRAPPGRLRRGRAPASLASGTPRDRALSLSASSSRPRCGAPPTVPRSPPWPHPRPRPPPALGRHQLRRAPPRRGPVPVRFRIPCALCWNGGSGSRALARRAIARSWGCACHLPGPTRLPMKLPLPLAPELLFFLEFAARAARLTPLGIEACRPITLERLRSGTRGPVGSASEPGVAYVWTRLPAQRPRPLRAPWRRRAPPPMKPSAQSRKLALQRRGMPPRSCPSSASLPKSRGLQPARERLPSVWPPTLCGRLPVSLPGASVALGLLRRRLSRPRSLLPSLRLA